MRSTPVMDALVHAIEDAGPWTTAIAIAAITGYDLPTVLRTLHRLEAKNEVRSSRLPGPTRRLAWRLADDTDPEARP